MLHIYVGFTGRDALAFEVCKASLLRHASIPIEIIPLFDWELRRRGLYWRSYRVDAGGQRWDDRDGKPFSTDYSFARFVVPILEDYGDDWVVSMDPDMLVRSDITKLLQLCDDAKAVMCVQHDHKPVETEKKGGLKQSTYRRKNWSSLMLMHPSRCKGLTKYAVNNQTGEWLHAMCWADEDEIGSLPESWNWLEGWSSPEINPDIIHFTRGTPDMPGTEDAAFADEWNDEAKWLKFNNLRARS